MGGQDEWEEEQGLADEDLRAIDDAIESAIKKRRSDDFVESSNPQGSRSRRLPRSIVALQRPRPNPNPLSRCEMRLSVMKFGGRILYSKTAIDVEQAANHLLHTIANSKSKKTQFVLGFDIEWRPTFTKGVSPGKAAVMQICGDTSHCHVMHIFHSGIPKSLQLLLEDPTLLKVGAGIANDAVKVFKDYNVSIKAVEDLSYLANQKLGGGPHQWGLGSLTKKLISKELVENDRVRNGNREALTALRKRARTTKTSVPSPFESIMRDIGGLESRPLVKEVCTTCGNHDSNERTWMMFPGTDLIGRIPFHAAHTILETDQAQLDFDAKRLQSYMKEKSLLISERGAIADRISPGVLKSLITLSDKPNARPLL